MFCEEKFATRVKQLRKDHGLKQGELGEIVGLSLQAISDIERGHRTTSIDKLVALADYFNVSIDYLVGRTDNPKGGIG